MSILHTLTPTAKRILQWMSLFFGLIAAVYVATFSTAAPLLILLIFLYVIVLNFSLQIPYGRIGLAPMLAVASLLIVGFQPALLALIIGLFLAELLHPLWEPVIRVNPYPLTLGQRLGQALIHLGAFVIASQIYLLVGGVAPIQLNTAANAQLLLPTVWLSVANVVAYLLLHFALGKIFRQPQQEYFRISAPRVAVFVLLAQPFALFGALTFRSVGLPAFVIFGVGVAGVMIIIWVSWQNRLVLQNQLRQFSALNEASEILRATLVPEDVLRQTYTQLTQLVSVDQFAIYLLDEAGEWERPFVMPPAQAPPTPDDFTRWVAENGRVLDLDSSNMHYADRYNLTPPQPRPDAWLGVPLMTADNRALGVMVLQRRPPAPPFSRWSREVLLTLARQASSALQNARIHSETVRLYTLTDEALARRVEQLQAVLNSTHEGVVMLDTAGKIVLANPLASRFLDKPSERLLGQSLVESSAAQKLGYTNETLGALLASLRRGEELERTSQIFEQRVSAEATRFIERSEAPVLAENGRVMGWLIVLRDVTESEERAQWRTQFTHMIVHDLRNPVTTLMSTMNTLRQRLELGAADPLANGTTRSVQELVQFGQQGCLRMLDMVDSLMDINRMEAGQLIVEADLMRLPPLIDQLIRNNAAVAEQRAIKLTADYTADLPPVWADEELVRRILVNLLDNALKFTPHGGTVCIRLTAEPAAEPARYETGLRCTLIDSGVGIPAEFKERIFERFVRIGTGGAQVRGTGIGLSFCKLAIEAQDGRIWVEDAPQGGSQFVFTLPGTPVFEIEA